MLSSSLVLPSTVDLSKSEMAARKMTDLTQSKQWIHFFRSERCPPTSNNLLSSKEDYVRDGILYRRFQDGRYHTLRKAEQTKETETHLKLRFLKEKCTSTIPVVLTRVRRISCSVGW